MLSRRNIRIKVLQMLYALEIDKEVNIADTERAFKSKVQQSYYLYLQALYIIAKTCELTTVDAQERKDKYLPDAFDKQFSEKLFENEAIQSLVTNKDFQRVVESQKFDEKFDEDNVKKLYRDFSKTEEFKNYILSETKIEDDIEILHELVRFMKSELIFHELLMDANSNWIDDDTHVFGALKKTLKSMPLSDKFMLDYYPDSETVDDFGKELLIKTASHSDKLKRIINPLLENWDMDRLALVDLIILKMAIAEFLYFESIPVHVTLNEYVELAKGYSTDKSKEFINGILDNAMKTLLKDGKINKKGRGLIN